MAEFVSAIIGPVVEALMAPIGKQLGYLFLSTKHAKKLDDGMKQLEGTFVDVKNHKDTNDRNTLEVPARVPGWLADVAKIKSDAETISRNGNGGCFNVKARHQMGRNTWKTTQDIERLLQEGLAFSWTDAPKPLGRVYTRRASTSAPSSSTGGDSIGEDFKSRAMTFNDALKLLQQDQKTQVIALCGMGGVGKTTMMLQLKKVAEDKKMFDWIVKVVIGRQPNWYSIQQAIADNLGNPLKEETETTRADRLHISFEETLKKSEKGILVILDDVWEKVELKDIGLRPLPNGVKLLLTSRNEAFCHTIAIREGNLKLQLLQVGVLEHEEAHNFLCTLTNISEESDPDLYEIGGHIVKKCSSLPFAIKLIAPTIQSKNKSIWRDRLRCLKKKGPLPDVQEIIKISYNDLDEEEYKEILLLCGLFPEDANIPMEDLTRYAWGLKLFKGVSTFGDARDRTITCVSNLKNANLLIDGNPWCVKMHDLVLAFVLDTISKGDHASIINHGDMSDWGGEDMSESCKRISLTCKGMSEFPKGFKCPNLSLLKLRYGDDSFKFPEGFSKNTEKLQVIAFEFMQYQLLPRSLQFCSTNLRMLCLHGCSLAFDISFIGDLSNLEVLSITESRIRKLPSTIGKLKKLKVLDLTGCIDLLIDDGVLKSLVNLEELYMTVSAQRAIRFTDANVDELVGCSKNLTALAIEFNVLPKNISFKKLERFKITLGCYLYLEDYESWYKFENTLSLVTSKCEILESGLTELFEKTEVLYLQVNDVTELRDVLVESLHLRSSFYNLRVLHFCNCANLRYLFTVPVANGLTKLECLKISLCPVLETVVHGNEGGVRVIKFQALKFLSLFQLPKLKSLCNVVNVIELPQLMELQLNGLPKFTSIYPLATSSLLSTTSKRQSFFNEEVVIPKLEKLHIHSMENLKEIWPCEFSSSEEVNVCILREIMVMECDSVVNLFPSNPMSLLHHLEDLKVENCGSIEVLFNIDLGCSIEETSCCLRSIQVQGLGNLREVWRLKVANDSGLTFNGFQAIETLGIEGCKRFKNVFTPTTISFDMRALTKVSISDCGESERVDEIVKSNQEQEINVMPNEEMSEVDNTRSNVVFSFNLMHTVHNIRTLAIRNYKRVDVVFEMESPCSREPATTQNYQKSLLLPYLKELELGHMKCMSHVWKCNWNKFLISQKQQPQSFSSSFHNLTTINLYACTNVKYLFSPLMAKLLSNLKDICIGGCDAIEEVVSNRDDEDEGIDASTSTNISNGFFPHLDLIYLNNLSNLKCIGGGAKTRSNNTSSYNTATSTSFHDFKSPEVRDVAWSLCQYAREIHISKSQALSYVIPSDALGEKKKIEKLTIQSCPSLLEVLETQGFNINGCDTTNIGEESGGNDTTMVIQRMKKINGPQVSNLKELVISTCDLLQYVFTFSTLESLTQLEKLRISYCKAMKVIVKEDNGEQTMISSKVVVFPRLKSIKLRNLPNLTSFFLGNNEFRWPVLDNVQIFGCPEMTMFTSGCSIAPKLNYIHKKFGKYSLECGLNFRVMPTTLHESPFSGLDTTNSCVTISEGIPWSFHNLVEINAEHDNDVQKIIPSNELLHLQKLEKIDLRACNFVKEVFEVLEGTDSNELQFVVVEIPKLREVELYELDGVEHIWKNNPWMVLEFPKLVKLSIHGCTSLEHVFTSSMVGSLLQLQDLHITYCVNMEVVVKEAIVVVEEGEGACDHDKVNEIITFPHLKSLKLINLPSLKGFCLGEAAFSWPALDTLDIIECPIRVFTKGDSVTPELRVTVTSFGRCELAKEEDLNSFINNKRKEGLKFREDEDEYEDEEEEEDEDE